jgi:hypothetical protein
MVAAAGNPGGGVAGEFVQAGLGVAMAGQMAGAMAGAAPAAGGPPPLPGQAGYHVEIGGQPAGPFTVAQLQTSVAQGQVGPATLAWTQGMGAWAPASSIPALQPLFAAPPPLPGTTAAPPPLPSQ